MGTVRVRSLPRRPKTLLGATRIRTSTSPAGPPPGPGAALPLKRRTEPSLTPAGTRNFRLRVRFSEPVPRHWVHGLSMTRPEPPQWGHGWEKEKNPWFWATTPRPEQVGQVLMVVPGSAPVPEHRVHGAGPFTLMEVVTPRAASSKLMLRSVWMSAPRCGPRRWLPPNPNTSPRPKPPRRS